MNYGHVDLEGLVFLVFVVFYVIFIVAFVVRRYTFESVACFGNSDRKCNRQFSFQITNIIIVIGLWGLVTEHVPNI